MVRGVNYINQTVGGAGLFMDRTHTMIKKLTENDLPDILECLCYPETPTKELAYEIAQSLDISVPYIYFDKKWIGYGYFFDGLLVAYCFIKNPQTMPETLTVTRRSHRNQGFARGVRSYAIGDRKFKGNVIHSSVKLSNPASLKSLLKADYQVFDVTRDGYIHLCKILRYKAEKYAKMVAAHAENNSMI